MALPLPILSWVQGNMVATGSTTPSTQQVIDAIDTALGAATYWERKSKTADYIEIGPKSGSAIQNFKAIIGGDPGAPAVLSPDTSSVDIWVGIAPDGGTLGTWNSATPYGGNRFSKYWKCCDDAVAESVYIVESDEVIAIFFKDDSVSNKYFGVILGAILEGTDQGSVEADDRIYGMMVSGTNSIDLNFLNNQIQFLGHQNTNGQDHIGIFKPTNPTEWSDLDRSSTTFNIDTGSSRVSLGGSYVSLPIFYHHDGATDYFAGMLRQIRAGGMLSNRQKINDDNSVLQATVFSATDNPSTNDSILFCES